MNLVLVLLTALKIDTMKFLLKEFTIKLSASLLALVVLLSSCSSSTVITSIPPAAKVTINGMYKGVTPYTMTDSKIIGSTSTVRLELDGYQPRELVISKDEKIDVGAVIGGIFFGFPFIWTMGYEPIHKYELTPEPVK